MNYVIVITVVILLFASAAFIYSNYKDQIISTFNLPNIQNKNAAVGNFNYGSNPQGLQASSIQRSAATQ